MAEKEYIDRQDVIEALAYAGLSEDEYLSLVLAVARKKVRKIPAANVVEVRHGEWLNSLRNTPWEKGVFGKCSLCNYLEHNTKKMPDYCAGCGAKMDGERKERDETRI
jgi:hypothetical protein